ncbi:MAG: CoA transferase [Dehalococcoidia bacterium]|nr:CoA transferase [Dehalococcoidia bacterium]
MEAGTLPTYGSGPLSGVRVVDFTWWVVGPWAPRLLADLGAEVIKVERVDQFDGTRGNSMLGRRARSGRPVIRESPNQSGGFNNLNANKLGATLNMRHPKGLELAERLIAKSDCVVENFSAGVMESWGLGWERMREINPRLIYVSLSGWGHSGAWSGYRSYGPTAAAISGLTYASGLPGAESAGWGFSYMDVQGGFLGSLALVSALYHAKRTGEGSFVDYSIIEGAMSMLGPYFLDFDVNGRKTRRPDFPPGNRSIFPPLAPHNTYRCTGQDAVGQDRWCFIACETEEQWGALCHLMGRPELARDQRFSSNAARVEHQDELDAIIQAWTEPLPRYDVMSRCQSAGIISGVVQNGEDRVEYDPQLRERGVYPVIDHPELGPYGYEAYAPKLSRTPAKARRGAPLYKEHNMYVYGELLGLSADEVTQLQNDGIV